MEDIQQFIEKQEQSLTIENIKIDSQIEYEKAGWMLKSLKSFIDEMDKKRKELTRPLDESKKKIMAMFSPVLDKAEKCERDIKSKMLVYMNKIEAEKKALEHEALKNGQQVVVVQEAKVEGIKKIKAWKAKIVNLDLIPRSFLLQTEKQHEALMQNLNAIAKKTNNAIEIPGVQFYEEETLSSTKAWDV